MMIGRLVVTGNDSAGRSVFVRDENLPRIDRPGVGHSFRYWSANETAVYPNSGENPRAPEYFPPVGGYRFFVTTLTPQGGRPATVQAELGDSSTLGTGLAEVMESDEPGMHTTNSTDFGFVISGQVALEVDNGAEVVLSAGDAIVQNGTRHRWRVVGDAPATIAFVLIGAQRAPLS
jgi:mannose-6-phosphate isomerase-like protein (cupin superfamily)